ncbi:hypothetical protein VHEMI09059 [[Torrubiella] hemipterigena]|uniref:Transcription factor domain-containing protein n=1 Tax=[Torrubiella] hemipterigena TaxID=1531966 RepID=A0A0A1TPC0_9HYPO|nr:hypothetical protein VHEMI09059 [[Torrubiella] hemipterigena]
MLASSFQWMRDVTRPGAQKQRQRQVNPNASTGVAATWTQPVLPVSPLSSVPIALRHYPTETVVVETVDDNTYGDSQPGSAESSALSSRYPPHTLFDSINSDVVSWIDALFANCFNSLFGFWMSVDACPLLWNSDPKSNAKNHALEQTQLDRDIDIVLMFSTLDRCVALVTNEEQSVCSSPYTYTSPESNQIIDQSLHAAIAAFTASWFPVILDHGLDVDNTIRELWRFTRRDTLRIINRPCYRSVLSLFLFYLTPIPANVGEDEERDGMSGSCCALAAIRHLESLRSLCGGLQFSGSKVLHMRRSIRQIASELGISDLGFDFIGAESSAYWLGLTIDVSMSLTLNCRSVLTDGPSGYNSEMMWLLIQGRATVFRQTTKSWLSDGLELFDFDRARFTLSTAVAWKGLLWKLVANVLEALRTALKEEDILQVLESALDAIQQYYVTFGPLLKMCQDRLLFLHQEVKLQWFSLTLHCGLIVLKLADALESNSRIHMLDHCKSILVDAESSTMNALEFGCHTHYTIVQAAQPDASDKDGDSSETCPSINPFLMNVYPLPHHVLASIGLMKRAIERDISHGTLTPVAGANLKSVLWQALDLLPQCSKPVTAKRKG